MEVVHQRCAGLDVHKKSVVVCRIVPGKQGCKREVKRFGTMTQDVLALADWLQAEQVTHVALESTGIYWRPIYNLLEGNFTLVVVNAHHIKLGSVASNVLGVSGRAMLEQLIAGQEDPGVLADLAKGVPRLQSRILLS